MEKKLVGCIKSLKAFGLIRTRFFFVDPENKIVKDVTEELCAAIRKFNAVAEEITKTGKYSMKIPFDFKNGIAEYSHGCGLSHYLQEREFPKLVERAGDTLSFPIQDCRISMYTPDDVKHILECKTVFDENIYESLKERYFKTVQ